MNIFSSNANPDISSNPDNNSNSKTDKDKNKEFLWFIGSITTSIVSILTASILLINLARQYKKKIPYQYAILLFGGFILLFVSSYINVNVIEHLKLYNDDSHYFVLMLKSILVITSCFIFYTLYMIVKTFKNKKK
uniref:Uncharacterized protein n=1 Tax=Florenciella sp. virus SA2 TaxID=3240092 RepID=A0AB39JEA6_9VIRU